MFWCLKGRCVRKRKACVFMKKPVEMRYGSIFRNIFSILAILIAITTAFNLTMTLFIRSRLFSDKMQEQNVFIDAYVSSMDDTFEALQNIFTYLQKNDAIQKHSLPDYREGEDYLQNEQAIIDLLSTFSFTSTAVNEILIQWDDSTYLYTKQGITERHVYFQNRFQGDYLQWNDLMSNRYSRVTVRKTDARAVSASQSSNSAGYLTGTSGIYLLQSIQSGSLYNGTICMVLEEAFINSIFRNQDFASSRQIFVLDQDQRVIAANTDASLDQLLYGTGSAGIKNASLYLEHQGMLSHRESAMSGVEYVIFTPYNQLAGGFDRIFLLANLFSAATVVALLAYAYWSSRKIYRPFRGILNALGASSGGEDSRDETSYITNRVLDILSVNNAMRNTIQNSSHMVLQAVLYKIIMGSPTVEEMLATANPYQISFSDGVYETAVVRLDLPPDQEELFYTKYYDSFTRVLHAHLGDWIVEVLETLPDEYTLVICLKSADEQEKMLDALQLSYESWRRQIPGAEFCIGVSNQSSDIHELKNCYEQSIAALRRRLVQSTQTIFFMQSETAEDSLPFLPDDLEVQLRELLEKSAAGYLTTYVKNILDLNYQNNVTYEAYLSACVVINRFVGRIVQGKDAVAFSDLIKINPTSYVYTTLRCREIVLSNLVVAAQISARKNTASVIDQVLDYVNEHFREDINLSSVALVLGYTPNHLSRCFKQNRGINFTDYLNSRRVAFAREQLITTSDNLNRIAEACGFHSSNLLIRAFEKYEGITPGEFRKNMRQQRKNSLSNSEKI